MSLETYYRANNIIVIEKKVSHYSKFVKVHWIGFKKCCWSCGDGKHYQPIVAWNDAIINNPAFQIQRWRSLSPWVVLMIQYVNHPQILSHMPSNFIPYALKLDPQTWSHMAEIKWAYMVWKSGSKCKSPLPTCTWIFLTDILMISSTCTQSHTL